MINILNKSYSKGEVDYGKRVLIARNIMFFSFACLFTLLIVCIICFLTVPNFGSEIGEKFVLFLMVPCIPLCIFSLITYFKMQEKLRTEAILQNIDLIHSLLGSDYIYTTESDINSEKIGYDPTFTTFEYNSIKSKYMLTGKLLNLNFKASNLVVKYNATQEESSSSYTNFEGYYILYKDVYKDLFPVHIRTRNLLEKHIINPDMNRPLKLGKELLYRFPTGIDEFDSIFIVTAKRGEDVKKIINDNNFRYLTQLFAEARDEFSLFFLENGDVGISISNFNIFSIFQLTKSNYDAMEVRRKMTEDLLKVQLYINASANFLHHNK